MGYRSDVAYIIEFKTLDDRDNFVTLMLAKNDEEITQAIGETAHTSTLRPIISFNCEDAKWYSEYRWVQAHTGFYRGAHELYDAAYKFIAIGEDGAEECDHEEGDDGTLSVYDDIYSVHRIEFNF
jgi:hypothetical protein